MPNGQHLAVVVEQHSGTGFAALVFANPVTLDPDSNPDETPSMTEANVDCLVDGASKKRLFIVKSSFVRSEKLHLMRSKLFRTLVSNFSDG